MSAKQVCDFLVRYESDDQFKKSYEESPDAAMDEYHLTDEEKKVIKSGDQTEIKRVAGGSDCPVPSPVIV
jgi:restriction endonuclease Mrr